MSVVKLVGKAKTKEEYRQEIVDVLRAALTRAESDEVDSILVIERRPDGYWRWSFGGDRKVVEIVGRLEIIKAEWIAEYLKDYAS